MKKFIKKYWKWIIIITFLPTVNGCQPSFGYPLSLPIFNPEGGLLVNFNLLILILILILNLILSVVLIKLALKYFKNNRLMRIFILGYFTYEGIIAIISIFFDKFGGRLYTLSFWVFATFSTYILERIGNCNWANGVCFEYYDNTFYLLELATDVTVLLIVVAIPVLLNLLNRIRKTKFEYPKI